MEKLIFNLNSLKISKRKKILLIEGIRFEINKESNFLVIIGDSGIGKTTIFKSLFHRYIQIWKQEKIFDIDCAHYFDNLLINKKVILNGNLNKNIGFATQVPYFFNNKTVRENLFGPLRWKNIRWGNDKIEAYIKLFKLEDLIDKEMSILSGGQRQLINIARMLVINPELAIIDECFSNMDEDMAHEYLDIISQSFPECLFLVTSHRRSDLDFLKVNSIKLVRQQSKSGKFFTTQR